MLRFFCLENNVIAWALEKPVRNTKPYENSVRKMSLQVGVFTGKNVTNKKNIMYTYTRTCNINGKNIKVSSARENEITTIF